MKPGFAVQGGGSRSTFILTVVWVPSYNLLRYLRQFVVQIAPTYQSENQIKIADVDVNKDYGHDWTSSRETSFPKTRKPTFPQCLCCHRKFPYQASNQSLSQFQACCLAISACHSDINFRCCALHPKHGQCRAYVRTRKLLRTASSQQTRHGLSQTPKSDAQYATKAFPEGSANFRSLRKGHELEILSETPTPPLVSVLSPAQRRLSRSRQALLGIPSDKRWMRTCIWKIKNHGLKAGEIYWNVARLQGRDLEDLKRVSKVLMQEYNKAGEHTHTLRLFRWYENAEEIESRRKRSGRDTMKRVNVQKYINSMKQRAERSFELHGDQIRTGSVEKDEAAIKQDMLADMIREILELEADSRQKIDETGSNGRPTSKYQTDKEEDVEAYLTKLKYTLLQARKKLPPMYTRRASTCGEDDLEGIIESWVQYGPPLSKFPGSSPVDTRALNFALAALLGLFDPENAINLYKQYMPLIRFSPLTWEYIIQAHLQADRLKQATGLIRFARHRKQWLTSKTYASVLHAVKTCGASWNKMVRYFKWLEGLSKQQIPAIYHIMIQTAIELGMRDEADSILHRMLELGLSHTRKTYENLLSAFAKVGDWERLKSTIAIMDSKGYQIRTDTFNAILNASAETAELAATEKLFQAAIDRGITPDVITYNIMIKACVYSRGADGSFLYWLSEMVKMGIKPTNYTFNTLFYDLRRNYRASAALLRRVYDRLLTTQSKARKYGLLADHLAKLMILRTMHEETSPFPQTYKEIRWTESLAHDRNFLALRMCSVIEAGKPEIALGIWKAYIEKGRVPSLQLILMAFRACILCNSPTQDVEGVLKYATSKGFNIPKVILSVMYFNTRQRMLSRAVYNLAEDTSHPLDELDLVSAGSIKLNTVIQKIEESYQFLEKHHIPIRHHVALYYANKLIDAGKHLAAIHLLHEVAKTKWGQGIQFDRYALTVLLKAYIKSDDLDGIKWVVGRIIAARERPTIGFYKMLKRYSKSFKKIDESRRKYLYQLTTHCRLHEAKLDKEAKDKALFLTGFAEQTVALKNRAIDDETPVSKLPEAAFLEAPTTAKEASSTALESSSDICNHKPHTYEDPALTEEELFHHENLLNDQS